jgi:hypothetical protein
MDDKTLNYMKERVTKGEALKYEIDSVNRAIQLALAVTKHGGALDGIGVEIDGNGKNCGFNGSYNIAKIIHNIDHHQDQIRVIKEDTPLRDIIMRGIIEYGAKRLAELQEEFDKL